MTVWYIPTLLRCAQHKYYLLASITTRQKKKKDLLETCLFWGWGYVLL